MHIRVPRQTFRRQWKNECCMCVYTSMILLGMYCSSSNHYRDNKEMDWTLWLIDEKLNDKNVDHRNVHKPINNV